MKYLFFILICLLIPVTSFGDLKDFKDDVNREEQQGGAASSGSEGGLFEEVLGSCFEACMSIFMQIWEELNACVSYSGYPYEPGYPDNFIQFDDDLYQKYNTPSDQKTSEGNIKPAKPRTTSDGKDVFGKNYFFVLDAAGLFYMDEGDGFHISLSGRFYKFFGPEASYERVDDGSDHLDLFSAGFNIPLIQLDGFSPDLYFQYTGMRGILKRDGGAIGVIINSYPIKPLALYFRAGIRSFENVKLNDYEARIGFMISRFQFFGGWRSLRGRYAEMGGPHVGVRAYF